MPARQTRRQALRAAGVALATGVAGCGGSPDPNERPPDSLGTEWTPPADGWQFPAGGPRHTAHRPHDVRAEPTVSWRSTPDERHDLHQFVAATTDRILGVGEHDETVALRAITTDGRRTWRRQFQLRGFWPGGVVDGTLYASDGVTDLLAVDTSDGSLQWRRSLYDQTAASVPDEFLSSGGSPDQFEPVVVPTPETVYVASGYGLHGVAPADGTEQWRLYLGESTEKPVGGQPVGLAPTEYAVLVTDRRRGVLRVERRRTGDEERVAVERSDTGVEPPTEPVITAHGGAVVGPAAVWSTRRPPHRPVVAAVAGRNWQFPGYAGSGTSAFAQPTTDGERVFCCGAHERPGDVVVSALRAQTGALEWRTRVTPAGTLPPLGVGETTRFAQSAVAGDTLLIGYGSDPGTFDEPATDGRAGTDGCGRGELFGFALSDGRLRWRRTLPVGPQRVAVTATAVYVYGHCGDVVAL